MGSGDIDVNGNGTYALDGGCCCIVEGVCVCIDVDAVLWTAAVSPRRLEGSCPEWYISTICNVSKFGLDTNDSDATMKHSFPSLALFWLELSMGN